MEQSQPETRLSELPPSSKLVVKVLEYNGVLTQREIVDHSRLPQRTVRDALDRLESEGLVESRVSFQDARQHLYETTFESPE